MPLNLDYLDSNLERASGVMATQAQVRRIAVSLPGTEETPNHFAFSVRPFDGSGPRWHGGLPTRTTPGHEDRTSRS
jgi:hypothetical protein